MKKAEILNKVKKLNKIPKEAKIAVIMGGMSAEREVSLRSGANCLNALREQGYKNAFSIDMDDDLSQKLIKKHIDIAFIALHGTYGEDGCVQGLLESLNIPYTGSNVMASAICMNKQMAKDIMSYHKIPSPQTIENWDNIKYPVYCKPVDQGSSLGAGLAKNKKEFQAMLKEIKKYSSKKPLIEEFIEGRELAVGILQVGDEIFATDILEIKVKEDKEYNYDTKYTLDSLEFSCPAKIDNKTTSLIKKHAINAFKAVDGKGFGRVDVILKKNKPFVLEINTIPGMTDQSDLPYQAKTFGINQQDLSNIILHSSLLQKDYKGENMPIFLIHLHHILHAFTGGFDCLILLVLLAPYFIYRVWIKKDFDVKKFLKKGKECNCHKNKKVHKKHSKK